MTAGCCCGGAAVIDRMNSIFGSLQAVFPSINVLQNQIAAFDGSHTSPELLRVADNIGSLLSLFCSLSLEIIEAEMY